MDKTEKHGQTEARAGGPKIERVLTRKGLMIFLKSNILVLLMLLGVILGVMIGAGLNNMDPKLNKKQIAYLKFPGDLFIQLMKMLIIPVVVSTLTVSAAEMDIRSSGKIGLRALVYYFSTLVLASALGMTLALTVRPGERIGTKSDTVSNKYGVSSSPEHAFMDLVRNMVPDNLIEVCFLAKKTEVLTGVNTDDGPQMRVNISNSSLAETFHILSANETKDQDDEVTLVIKKVPGTNMVGLVVSSIVFGCAISAVGLEARPLLMFLVGLQAVSFRLIAVFIWTAPVGIAFLIIAKLAQLDDMSKTFQDLAIFSATVVGGLAFHGLVILPLIYLIFVRRNPFKFISGLLPAIVFAFGSSSSVATLPVNVKCLQNRVDPRVAKLVATLGSTLNMDGTCLYYSMMCVFVAQINNIPLSVGDCVTICLLAISISAGASGVPGMGIVYMLTMLVSTNLPTDDISTILAVDWILARCRCVINILGDGIGAGIIEHLSRRELRDMDRLLRESEPPKSDPGDFGEESVALVKTRENS